MELVGRTYGFWGAPIVFLTVWFQMERCEALLSTTIIGHVLQSMVKNDTDAKSLRNNNGGSSLL
jgi:hypothetical protein